MSEMLKQCNIRDAKNNVMSDMLKQCNVRDAKNPLLIDQKPA